MAENTTISPEYQFPKYEFTFKIVKANFDSTNLIVEYTPVDTRFTKITLSIPILADFNPQELTEYVGRWAPHSKWFAQEMILTYNNDLIGANTNISVS